MKIKECVLIESIKCKDDDNIVTVSKMLKETTLRHIFVVDNDDKPVGVISVIDINNRVVANEKDPKTTLAKDIMSSAILTTDVNDDVDGFFAKMSEKNHVMDPVTNDGKMVGIITIHQLLKNIKK